MASKAENEAIVHTSPEILTTSDCQERVQSMEDQVCDVETLPVPESSSPELLIPLVVEEEEAYMTTSHDADAILDQEFVVPFPDPAASTLEIHGSATSHQGVQGISSLPSSSEQMALRAASSANHSEVVHENGVQSPNISTLNAPLANNPTMGQNPPRHLFSDPYEYELEKIRIEEDNLKKSVEVMTSQLMAELDKKMAEARRDFDRVSQEFDAACQAKVMEVEAHMSLVRQGSLLANAFMSKCSERSASNDLAAVRAMFSQHSTQQQQAVHMNSTVPPRARPQQQVQASTHMSAPPRPCVTSVEAPVPNSSGPLPHLPRPMSQQTAQAHTHVNSTAPPPPPITAVEPETPNHLRRPLVRFHRPTTTPMSQQAVAQSNTKVNSTEALARPSVTTEALPLHSPLSNTPRPRPRPVISNLTTSSSPHVQGTGRGPAAPHIVRASAPHLARRPAPHLRQYGSSGAPMSAAAATTMHPRRSVQEQEQQQQQQQGKSKDGLVHLSDED